MCVPLDLRAKEPVSVSEPKRLGMAMTSYTPLETALEMLLKSKDCCHGDSLPFSSFQRVLRPASSCSNGIDLVGPHRRPALCAGDGGATARTRQRGPAPSSAEVM